MLKTNRFLPAMDQKVSRWPEIVKNGFWSFFFNFLFVLPVSNLKWSLKWLIIFCSLYFQKKSSSQVLAENDLCQLCLSYILLLLLLFFCKKIGFKERKNTEIIFSWVWLGLSVFSSVSKTSGKCTRLSL